MLAKRYAQVETGVLDEAHQRARSSRRIAIQIAIEGLVIGIGRGRREEVVLQVRRELAGGRVGKRVAALVGPGTCDHTRLTSTGDGIAVPAGGIDDAVEVLVGSGDLIGRAPHGVSVEIDRAAEDAPA